MGLGALVAFFALHAAIVTPIWTRVDAMLRGIVLAPLAGAVLSVALHRLVARGEPRFAHALGGMLVGALAGLTLAPFAVAGWLRARGAPDPFWIAMLVILLVGWHQATLAAQAHAVGASRARRLELPVALLLATAFPAFFLTFIADFHDEMPDPFPFTFAVAEIFVAGGAALAVIRGRRADEG